MMTRCYLLRMTMIACFALTAAAQQSSGVGGPAKSWNFAVSGDSRNCGNVVMPAIAAAVKKYNSAFYWHLGDFRAIYKFDEDYVVEPGIIRDGNDPKIFDYLSVAWDDFLAHQISPFGDTPVYLAPGSHEIIPPKTHDDYMKKFGSRLDTRELRGQRLQDNPLATTPAAYYHWVKDGIDFISLDNSVNDSFDEAQLNWFFSIVARDETDSSIRTIVAGMHAALPDSFSASHSMCSSPQGIASGRAVYRALVHARQAAHKNVYVLASHSHFYLENAYNTSYWNDPKQGGVVLPGWVIGSAGAVRYKLPPNLPPGTVAKDHVYGFMTGTVAADGTITFAFHPLSEYDLKQAKLPDYTDSFVQQCFKDNPPANEMVWYGGDDPCGEQQP
jgi:hypothetical protein